ncbi:hypothetical protein CB0940_01845 [Cercospora beticola]|uniref:Uncharacterized protein n=1 Tax=Cercospora beticola TaxID=122368 RepID=A0A2G5IA51_CERBT|nr:hypothetical protein CB0940_01845 [Cercospora beticola]PIB01353.1 hypothetical protein CB0940_01845 [Cercospora beticola]WPA97299.1 hypothetical protein RHO25_001908 [Cercospora beticola]
MPNHSLPRWKRQNQPQRPTIFTATNAALVAILISVYFGFVAWLEVSQDSNVDKGMWLNHRLEQLFHGRNRQLHVLVPATQSTKYLCQNLATAIVNRYPPPTFLKWGEDFPDKDGFMFKVSKTLEYLDRLPAAAEQRGDLVLLVDGYDLWFMLPPEVLLQNYFAALDETNRELSRRGILGIRVEGKSVRNSVMFSADHPCWPSYADGTPACSLVPLPPELDEASKMREAKLGLEWKERRYLNSGTIIGPIAEIKAMMKAAMVMYREAYDEDNELHFNDQLVLSDLWGEQERRRVDLVNAVNGPAKKLNPSIGLSADIRAELADPDFPPRKVAEQHGSPEFGITLDYVTNLAQIVSPGGIDLAWVRANHASLSLPVALQNSRPFQRLAKKQDHLSKVGWGDVSLGLNVINNQFFTLWHAAGEKQLRDTWWPRLWFHPYGLEVIQAATPNEPIGTIRGAQWTAATPFGGLSKGAGAGAWSDKGEWLSWDKVCRSFENLLFNVSAETAV